MNIKRRRVKKVTQSSLKLFYILVARNIETRVSGISRAYSSQIIARVRLKYMDKDVIVPIKF